MESALALGDEARPTTGVLDEARQLMRLAIPLASASFGSMLLGIEDTAIVGRLGETELGAVGLANALFFASSVAGFGLVLGLDPLVSQAIGAGEVRMARRWLWQGVWIAGLASVPLMLVLLALVPLIGKVGVDPRSVPLVGEYVYARLPSLPLFLLFAALRSYLQASSATRPILISVLVANLVNVPAAIALVFGVPALGVPALGVAGAGAATTFATLAQVGILAWSIRGIVVPPGEGPLRALDLALVRRGLVIGLPMGLTLLAEVGVFAILHVLVGRIGGADLAGHQIAMTLASATFMVPLGIGQASSVRVGHAIGRGDTRGTRLAGLTAIGCGAAFMVLAAIVLLLIPEPLARILTDKPGALAAAVVLIRIAAFFQISDGVQAVASGALRGAGDTRWPLAAHLVGHYAFGLSGAVLFAFGLGFGTVGLWWGMVTGLTAVATLLTVRFVVLTRRPIARA